MTGFTFPSALSFKACSTSFFVELRLPINEFSLRIICPSISCAGAGLTFPTMTSLPLHERLLILSVNVGVPTDSSTTSTPLPEVNLFPSWPMKLRQLPCIPKLWLFALHVFLPLPLHL